MIEHEGRDLTDRARRLFKRREGNRCEHDNNCGYNQR